MSLINRPHDKFFKETMQDVETAHDFLTNYLPKDILQLIDLDNLSLQKDSFIEKELQEAFSDILYKTSIKGQETYLYFLFEHKSTPFKTTALQLLKYMVRIWEQKIDKERAAALPIIIPLVIYHGETKWRMGKTLSSIIDDMQNMPESIKRYIPDYEYIVYDFSPLSDREIKGNVKLKIFLEILKAIFKKEPDGFLEAVRIAFMAMEKLNQRTRGIDYLETLIRYIMSARQDIEFKDVYNAVKEISVEGSEIIMTIAEQLINEGMQKGLEKGMEKGFLSAKSETAMHLLTKKFGILPEEMQNKIQKADADTLNFILDNIFDLTSLEDVAKYFRG